uniref:Putative secreted protein n=1 Tax=Rhipicephalus microplus TaxID=6941 RepID=A0A6M2DD86_RHIMP
MFCFFFFFFCRTYNWLLFFCHGDVHAIFTGKRTKIKASYTNMQAKKQQPIVDITCSPIKVRFICSKNQAKHILSRFKIFLGFFLGFSYMRAHVCD